MRRFFLVTHRWLGLAAALILALVGGSGAILVWSRKAGLAQFHTHLGLGEPGEWLVNGSTIGFLALALGGFVLWWRRKIVMARWGRGWWRFLFDVHHALGVLGAALTLTIAGSGLGLMVTEAEGGGPPPASRQIIMALHAGRDFGGLLRIVWAAASISFLVQSGSGVVMWWRSRRAGGDTP